MKIGRLKAFTLIELMIVIVIIAILASLLYPILTKGKARAQGSKCVSNLRQIAQACRLYTQDWDGAPVPMYVALATDAQGNWIQKRWWPYLLLTYTEEQKVLECPSFGAHPSYYEPPDPNAVDAYYAQTGYGMNWYYLSTWYPNYPAFDGGPWLFITESEIRAPSKKIYFCDSQDAMAGPNPSPPSDAYAPVTYLQWIGGAWPMWAPHDGRMNALFYDGHVEALQPSLIPEDRWNPFQLAF
jgi:prepilin-type N-terminal cleavage/methylation domain-containing protein/prepilin-type processing-associated H-X9-DG protein